MSDAQTSPASRKRNPTRDLALISVFAAFIAACSIISIPIGAAPITLQTFAVLLAGAVLGSRRGLLAVLLYLAIGAIGLPVFAGGGAGIAEFVSPTGGYLLGFPLAAWLAGFLVERLPGDLPGQRRRGARGSSVVNRTLLVFLSVFVANLVFVYPLGIAGLMTFAGMDLQSALILNLGFLPLDLVKMMLAAFVAAPVHRAFPQLLPVRTARRRASRATPGSASANATPSDSPSGSPSTPRSSSVQQR